MNHVKQWVDLTLNDPAHADRSGRIVSCILLVLISLNAALVFVVFDERLSSGAHEWLYLFDAVSTLVFLAEYLGRIWTADSLYPGRTPLRARVRYVFSLYGFIDLLAFLPIVPVLLGLAPYQVMNSFRVVRVVRLIKISRYMDGLKAIGNVFRKRRHEIIAAFAVLLLLTLTASILMYQAENPVQPEVFDSIFTGMYWAMTTITTTGYGDITPVTGLGRLIGFCTMVCSIAVVAIPTGIFSAGFVDEMRSGGNNRPTRRGIRANGRGAGAQRDGYTGADTDGASATNATPSDTVSSVEGDALTDPDDAAADDDTFSYCPYCGRSLIGHRPPSADGQQTDETVPS